MADLGINKREQRGRATSDPATLTIAFGRQKNGRWAFTFFVEKDAKGIQEDMSNTYSRYEDVFDSTIPIAESKLIDMVTDAKKYLKINKVELRWKDGSIFKTPDESILDYIKEGNTLKSALNSYLQNKKGETSVFTSYSFNPDLLRLISIKLRTEKRPVTALITPVRAVSVSTNPNLKRITAPQRSTRLTFQKPRQLEQRRKVQITLPQVKLPTLPQTDLQKRLEEGVTKRGRRLLK